MNSFQPSLSSIDSVSRSSAFRSNDFRSTFSKLSFLLAMGTVALFASVSVPRAKALGDPRNPAQPKFPAVCSVELAELSIVDGEPSSETAFDTSRIQAAMDACKAGEAVELASSGGTQSAFLLQPVHIPTGVTLQVDGGVTVFASSNPADYQRPGIQYPDPGWTVYTCGTEAPNGTSPNGCFPLFTTGSSRWGSATTGSGIIGYGVIDGRGGSPLRDANGDPLQNPFPSTCAVFSWWCLVQNSSIPGTNIQTATENNPMLINPIQASSFTLYMISLVHAPYFNVRWAGGTGKQTVGFTAWGVKIIGPADVGNTDGIDPVDNYAGVTIRNTYISNGDDNVAITANQARQPASGISITNVYTFGGDGIAIGTGLLGGVSNVLVNGLYQNGEPNLPSSGQAGIKIKSNPAQGGKLVNIAFTNICMQNQVFDIMIDPTMGPSAGASPPLFGTSTQPILFENITATDTPNSNGGALQLQGLDNSPTYIVFNNVDFGPSPKIKSSQSIQNVNIKLGPGPVNPIGPKINVQALSGVGVHYTGSIGKAKAFACSASSYPQLVGQMYVSTGDQVKTDTNLQTLRLIHGTPFYLNLVLEPTTYESAPPTTFPVTFYDGTTLVGTATLGSNGTLATFTDTTAKVGTHSFTAYYQGDSNYRPLTFGPVKVTVTQ